MEKIRIRLEDCKIQLVMANVRFCAGAHSDIFNLFVLTVMSIFSFAFSIFICCFGSLLEIS